MNEPGLGFVRWLDVWYPFISDSFGETSNLSSPQSELALFPRGEICSGIAFTHPRFFCVRGVALSVIVVLGHAAGIKLQNV